MMHIVLHDHFLNFHLIFFLFFFFILLDQWDVPENRYAVFGLGFTAVIALHAALRFIAVIMPQNSSYLFPVAIFQQLLPYSI